MSAKAPAAWDPQPNEPPRWYARFEIFRSLGPHRTIENAFKMTVNIEGLKAKRPGASWYDAAKTWSWSLRSAAYDADQRDYLRKHEHDRRFDARENRLGMIDELLASVFHVLTLADLPQLQRDEARAWLPTMRVFFRDLVGAQRAEIGLPVQLEQEGTPTATFNADELRQAQRELAIWQKQQRTYDAAVQLRDVLAALYPDEASARRIAGQSHLDLGRIAFSRTAVDNWHAVITETEHAGRQHELLTVVQHEYPENPALRHAANIYHQEYSP
jgi:hypothetical protein